MLIEFVKLISFPLLLSLNQQFRESYLLDRSK